MKKTLILALALLTTFSFSACSLINSYTEKTIGEENSADNSGKFLPQLYEGVVTIDGVEYSYLNITIEDFQKKGWEIALPDGDNPSTFYGEINLVKGEKSFYVQNSYSEFSVEGETDVTLPIAYLTERIENYSEDYKPVFQLPGKITLMDDYTEISAAYGKPAEYSGTPTSGNISYGLTNGAYIYFNSSAFLDEATDFTNTYRSLSIQAAMPYGDNPVAAGGVDVLPENIGDKSPTSKVSVDDSTVSEKSPDVTLEASTEEVTDSPAGFDMTNSNIDDAPVNLNDDAPVNLNDNPVEGA